MDDTPQHHAWVNPEKSRYYRVHLDRDLFGDWTLRKVWGGIDSSGGRMHNTGVPSYDEGVEQIREIAKRRCQRGYECVSRSPLHQSGSQSSDQTLASGPNPLSANLDNGPAHSLSTEPVSATVNKHLSLAQP